MDFTENSDFTESVDYIESLITTAIEMTTEMTQVSSTTSMRMSNMTTSIAGLTSSSPMNISSMVPASGRTNAVYKSFSVHRRYSIYFQYELYLTYYSFLLILVGTVCNLISFSIMIRKSMRKFACMRYLAMLSISDVIVLYQWNLNTVFKYNFSRPPYYKELEERSLFWCRWISFWAFTSLQMSSWFLSIVSFDRLMVVYSSFWKRVMNKSSKVNLIIGIIVLTLIFTNLHILFNNGYVEEEKPPGYALSNTTSVQSAMAQAFQLVSSVYDTISRNATNSTTPPQKHNVVCYRSKSDRYYIFPKWEKAHLVIYNLIPFAIMLTCNSMIIYNVKFARKVQSKNKASSKRKRRMTFMLILVTFSFMALTLPSVIVHTFFRDYLSTKPYRRLVNVFVNNLLHTSHAINFFLYVVSAPNFRTEFLRLLNVYKRQISTRKTNATINRSRATTKRTNAINKARLNEENDNDDDDDDDEESPPKEKIERIELKPCLINRSANKPNHAS
jgi:hypothetical protein